MVGLSETHSAARIRCGIKRCVKEEQNWRWMFLFRPIERGTRNRELNKSKGKGKKREGFHPFEWREERR